jgi:hypothetical protein
MSTNKQCPLLPKYCFTQLRLYGFGSYCVKATVEATGKNGVVDRTFIGYSQNMNITMKTQVACDRYKLPGTECGEATLVIKGGECDEVIMMKTRDGRIMNLSTPG